MTNAVTDHSRALSAGDSRVRALFTEHFDFIWRTLRRVGLSEAAADDGAQEVFLIMARKLGSLEAGRERSFLFGTALRVAANARRSASRRPEVADDLLVEAQDPAPRPDELLDQRRARALLDVALDALQEDLRVVLVLTELESMTAPEISALLELPVGTVASRLRRARDEFQIIMKRLKSQRAVHGGAS